MANEVIIEEYADFLIEYEDGTYAPVVGKLITSQVIDVGSKSAALNPATKVVTLSDAGGSGFWYKTGASDVSAVANTAGNRYIPAGMGLYSIGINVKGGETHIDTAAVV